MFDYKAAKESLELLYAAAASLRGDYNDQIRRFIDVGEYGLALDGIADTYITTNAAMPANLFQLFEKLASDMDLSSDPEFSGVAELRKIQAASVPSPASGRGFFGQALPQRLSLPLAFFLSRLRERAGVRVLNAAFSRVRRRPRRRSGLCCRRWGDRGRAGRRRLRFRP